MERRFTSNALTEVRVKERADGSKAIVGYAAVYYDGSPGTEFELMPGLRERIMPGAFDRVVTEDDVRALFNHDRDNVLGRNRAGTLRLAADQKGLRYEIDPPDTQIARDLITLIERGDITGSSFAFSMSDKGRSVWIDEGDEEIRQIEEIGELFDVSPVTFPAYEATTTGVRDQSDAAAAIQERESRRAEKAQVRARIRQRQCHARMAEIQSQAMT